MIFRTVIPLNTQIIYNNNKTAKLKTYEFKKTEQFLLDLKLTK